MSANRRNPVARQAITRDRAIAALLTSRSIRAASKACGVADSTLRRWLQQPDFARAFRDASGGLLDGAVACLQAGLIDAAETLRRNLTCQKPAVEVTAARAVWEMASSQTQLATIAEQLDELEQRVKGMHQRRKP